MKKLLLTMAACAILALTSQAQTLVYRMLNVENVFDSADSCPVNEQQRQEHRSKIMAELMGRQSGYCKGRGGSMHTADE